MAAACQNLQQIAVIVNTNQQFNFKKEKELSFIDKTIPICHITHVAKITYIFQRL